MFNLFQSAPLTKARGDGDWETPEWEDNVFQSAPLTKARGDGAGTPSAPVDPCFNPLPSPKQGET